MKKAEPQKEHRWLHRLVGEWTYETDEPRGPGEPAQKATGTERVRPLGEFWVLAEGDGDMPGGSPVTTMMTLGYDADKQHFVGTWIGSMMPSLWVYEGHLDAAERMLTLDCEGPSMTGDGTTSRYQDIIEFTSDEHRVLTARVLDASGDWQQLMRVDYRRR